MARIDGGAAAGSSSQARSQHQDERRKLRVQYRGLIKAAEDKKDDLVAPNSSALGEMLKQQEVLHQSVCKPREQAVDSELMSQLSEYGVALAQKLNPNSETHNPKDFVNRLKSVYCAGLMSQNAAENPDAFDWGKLGERVTKYFRVAPSFSCMLGPMKAEAKIRAVAQRRARTEVGELINPELVEENPEDQQQETDKNMKEIVKILKAHKRLPVPELVNNPRSFAQTVENIFALSFLVRDGNVKLTADEGVGIMAERGVMGGGNNQGAGGDGGEGKSAAKGAISQFVMSYDMRMWEEMQAVLDPAEGYMSHRIDRTHNTGVGPGRGAGRAGALKPGSAGGEAGGSGGSGGGGGGRASAKAKGKGRAREQVDPEEANGADGEDELDDSDDEPAPRKKKSRRSR